MRTPWFIAAIVLFSPAASHAQIRFSETSLDVGEIRGGKQLTKQFSFTNTASEVLHITEVRPGCGCLAVRLSSKEVVPGEKGAIEIDLRTLGQTAGPHTWTAHVRYRCGETDGEVPLRIAAQVINDIQLQPAALTLIARGPLTQELTLIDSRARPLRIEHVHTSSPFLKARVVNQTKNADGHRQIKLAVELTRDCRPGQYSESLAIDTNDPEYRRLVVPVAVTMSSSASLYAQPSTLEIVVPSDGPALSRFIRIGSALSGPVIIEKVNVAHPAVSCTWSRGPDNAATIRIRIDPARISDALETTLSVHVSDPRHQMLNIPLRVRID